MLRAIFLIVSALSLNACAAVAPTLLATGTGVAAGTGVEHTMSGIAYKTFAVSQNQLRFAALKALHRMDMKVEKDQKSQEERVHEIVANAFDRKIEIEIESLTGRTSRIRVVANKGEIFFKDAATATEIIMQTAHQVDQEIEKAERNQRGRAG